MANRQETKEEKEAREMVESIASNISILARSVSALFSGRLKKKTILVLLAHSTGLTQAVVERVLDAAASMEEIHLNK